MKEPDPIRERCVPIKYDPETIPWETVKNDIVEIEQSRFKEIAYSEKELRSSLCNPDNTIIILRDMVSGKVIGYTCAEPLNESVMYYSKSVPRDDNGEQTAYITSTAILSDYSNHHLVEKLISTLENVLVSRTDKMYRFLERDSVLQYNYAANIAKNYADRIVYQSLPHHSAFGDQIFFRIRLNRPE